MRNFLRGTTHHSGVRFLLAVAGVVVLVAYAPTSNAQERTTLRKVEIHGLQRLSADQVIAASGLKVGDAIQAAIIDAAAEKLLRSGWFQSVDYRVRTADNDTIVVFELVEKVAAITSDATETLGQVLWSGNAALSAGELSNAFALRAGEPAPRAKIDQALDRVRKAYSRRGYVNAQISNVARRLDGRRTNYEFTVREGQQYRMGNLSITGLSPADTHQLKSKWTLAADAIFDDSYLEQFRTTVIRPFVASRAQRTGVRSKFEISMRPDIQKHTADVIITFK